jgi:ubiquinone/menaquinone biosynthesis C-methylase UbiE
MHDRVFRASQAHKLEDPERLKWLPPIAVLEALRLRPGMVVADIGAGTGYFASPIGRVVGHDGKVFAVDFQQQMLTLLREKLNAPELPRNLELVAGSATASHLPGQCCELAFYANIWHELDDHAATLQEAARIVRRGGRIAILDWRPDVSSPPGPPLEHRIAPVTVAGALRAHRWECENTLNIGTYSYLVTAMAPQM